MSSDEDFSQEPMADDKFFLCYCELHSETQRALFSAAHCRRLFDLAGEPYPAALQAAPETQFFAMHEPLVDDLAAKARARSVGTS